MKDHEITSGDVYPDVAWCNDGPLVEINNDTGGPLVSINRDGAVTYGDGVDLDDASRRFWDALSANIPPTLTQEDRCCE